MQIRKTIIAYLFATLLIGQVFHCSFATTPAQRPTYVYTQTGESNQSMTPLKALNLLIEGNRRFVKNAPKSRNLAEQAKLTASQGQYPFAIILSCIDSRGSPEIIFDQGIGDIFSTRLAGNVLDADQLGGIEFATKAVGSHLIVVMGHTRCGAVRGACQNVELGNLTQLLKKIQPAVATVKKATATDAFNCADNQIIDDIAKQNVLDVMKEIPKQSKIVAELVKSGDVKIVGAMHDIKTGKVSFM